LKLAFFYFLWLKSQDIADLCVLFVDAWVRDLIVKTVAEVGTAVGYLGMAYVLWPTRAEDFFMIQMPDVQGGGEGTDEEYEAL